MKVIRTFLLLVALSFSICTVAESANGPKLSFIRDAEIETNLRLMATPLFQAANLDPQNVRIYLVKDKQINAFVAGGPNIFFHTGLLLNIKSASELVGVIAHETGHIAGGHLSRANDAEDSAMTQMILGAAVGVAAGLAAERGDLAFAIASASVGIGQRSYLAFSRAQEAAADQAAVRYLDSTGHSSAPFTAFMETLSDQELLPASRQDPYVRTHPLSLDRIRFLKNHVEGSPHSDAAEPEGWTLWHARMVAKLEGFLRPFRSVINRYPETDTSLAARYARAIAYYRRPDPDKALSLLDGLIADYPDDPYFLELKGQILYENGRVQEALAPYQQAVNLLPDNALLRAALAQARLESGDPAQLNDAIVDLNIALREEPHSIGLWRQLAVAQGRNGQTGDAALSLAEAAFLLKDMPQAAYHAKKASDQLKKGSVGWIKAQDIFLAANSNDKREDKKN